MSMLFSLGLIAIVLLVIWPSGSASKNSAPDLSGKLPSFFQLWLESRFSLRFIANYFLSSYSYKVRANSPIKPKALLTKREQPMYLRLQEALPNHIILCQVSFSAFLTTRALSTRAKFSQKVADFVVCNEAFEIIAIIELDDSSHKYKKHADAMRDTMLKKAGYKVLRYKFIPDKLTLKSDISG